MEAVTREVYDVLTKTCKKDTMPIELITKGVEVLQHKNDISKSLKREILKAVLERIAYGGDGIAGTEDDRLSERSLMMLQNVIDSEIIDILIAGIVAGLKKTNVKKCFKRWLW